MLKAAAQGGRGVTGCGSTHSDRLPGWRERKRGGQLTLNSQRLFVQAEKMPSTHCIVTALFPTTISPTSYNYMSP